VFKRIRSYKYNQF